MNDPILFWLFMGMCVLVLGLSYFCARSAGKRERLASDYEALARAYFNWTRHSLIISELFRQEVEGYNTFLRNNASAESCSKWSSQLATFNEHLMDFNETTPRMPAPDERLFLPAMKRQCEALSNFYSRLISSFQELRMTHLLVFQSKQEAESGQKYFGEKIARIISKYPSGCSAHTLIELNLVLLGPDLTEAAAHMEAKNWGEANSIWEKIFHRFDRLELDVLQLETLSNSDSANEVSSC
jgi:hypothetical protein